MRSFIFICMIVLTTQGWGQFSFTSLSSVYNQNFQTYAGSLATMPPHWTSSYTTYGGYYSNTGPHSAFAYNYAYDQNGTGEYCMGGRINIPWGATYTVSFRNNIPGATITALNISWDVEQYSRSSGITSLELLNNLGGSFSGPVGYPCVTGATGNLPTVIVTKYNVVYSGLSIPTGTNFQLQWRIITPGILPPCHVGFDDVKVTIASALPVELNSFKAEVKNQVVELSWQTASEYNNSHFEVERSTDARSFVKIGEIPGNGTTNVPQYYRFNDFDPPSPTVYYRLKQVDFDGSFSYSHLVAAKINNTNSPYHVAQRTGTREILILRDEDFNEEARLDIFTISGHHLKSYHLPPESHQISTTLPELSTGTYIISIQSDNYLHTQKIIF